MLQRKLQDLIVEKAIPLLSESKQLEESKDIIEKEIRSIILDLISTDEQIFIDKYRYLLVPQKEIKFNRSIRLDNEDVLVFNSSGYYWPFHEVFEIQLSEDIFYPSLFEGEDNMDRWLRGLKDRNGSYFKKLVDLLTTHLNLLIRVHEKELALSHILRDPQLGLTELKKYFPELYKIVKG